MSLRSLIFILAILAFWTSPTKSFAQDSDLLDQEVAEVEGPVAVINEAKKTEKPKVEIKKTESKKEVEADSDESEVSDPLDKEVSEVADDFEDNTQQVEPAPAPKKSVLAKKKKPFALNANEGVKVAPTAPPKKLPVKNLEMKTNLLSSSENNGVTPGTDSPNPREIFNNPGGAEKVIKAHHPGAANGLLKINKDKSYQYQVPVAFKDRAMSFSFTSISSPKISSSPASGVNVDYATMYQGSNIYGLLMSYEWFPFKKYGTLGLLLEGGLSYGHGNGVLLSGNNTYPAQETYTLFIVPMTAFLKYRLEYWKSQWLVPYVEGGGTYYGLAELRSDNSTTHFAGAPAIGGGGGLLINLSKFDPNGSFGLAREYGVADLWLNFEARAMAGAKSKMDFTNSTINFGIVADF